MSRIKKRLLLYIVSCFILGTLVITLKSGRAPPENLRTQCLDCKPDVISKPQRPATIRVLNKTLEFASGDKDFVPWADDPECADFNIRTLKKHSLSVMAVASAPGAGNTWMRWLVESSTGVFTGSIYHDGTLYRAGMLGELRNYADGSTILQKSHLSPVAGTPFGQYFYQETLGVPPDERRAVYIIRDPFKCILAYWNWQHGGGHTGVARDTSFSTKMWEAHVELRAKDWLMLSVLWIHHVKHLHIVYFENLTGSLREELDSIFKFLNLSKNEKRIDCAVKHSKGNFQRKKHQEMKDIYTRKFISMISTKIYALWHYMVKLNLPPLPLHKYQLYDEESIDLEKLEELKIALENLNMDQVKKSL